MPKGRRRAADARSEHDSAPFEGTAASDELTPEQQARADYVWRKYNELDWSADLAEERTNRKRTR